CALPISPRSGQEKTRVVARASVRKGRGLTLLLSLSLLLLDLLADLVHVQLLSLGDEVVEGLLRQHASLAGQQDTVAEHHDRRDGLDLQGCGKLLVSLGVHLAEGDRRVLLGGRLVNRAKALAWAAPVCPEVQQDDAFLTDGLLEVLASDFLRSHVLSLTLITLCPPGVSARRGEFLSFLSAPCNVGCSLLYSTVGAQNMSYFVFYEHSERIFR